MKKVFLIGAIGLFSFMVAEVSTWSSDAAHSRFGFSIKHMGISEMNGQFDTYNITMSTPTADFSNATIEMTAEAKSINTGLGMRDDHLRGSDFFDVEKYPTLSFKSTSVKKEKGNKYKVTGDLTMHGITKTVSFTALHNGTAKNRNEKDVAGFKMTGTIKRSDFQIGDMGPGLSDEVKLMVDLEATKN